MEASYNCSRPYLFTVLGLCKPCSIASNAFPSFLPSWWSQAMLAPWMSRKCFSKSIFVWTLCFLKTFSSSLISLSEVEMPVEREGQKWLLDWPPSKGKCPESRLCRITTLLVHVCGKCDFLAPPMKSGAYFSLPWIRLALRLVLAKAWVEMLSLALKRTWSFSFLFKPCPGTMWTSPGSSIGWLKTCNPLGLSPQLIVTVLQTCERGCPKPASPLQPASWPWTHKWAQPQSWALSRSIGLSS